MTKPRIGFIGVGLMGHGMAKNIVEKGYALTVMGNRNRAPVEDLLGRGAAEARTPADVARASDVVFICVTDSTIVEFLARSENGLKAGAREGLIIVDCSTSNPVSTLELAAEFAALGTTFCDAPLSRTPKEAWEGKLDTMIGADDATFAAIKPVCETWAGKIVHLGPVGIGHKMKLVNNFIAMGYAAIYSEALALSQKVGITPQMFDSVIRGGRMECGFYQTFFRYVLERDRDAHKFTLSNAHKDMRYLSAMADSVAVANPVGSAVKNSYALALGAGRGDDYVPMLSDVIATANGTKLA